jgi:hypothetical protein
VIGARLTNRSFRCIINQTTPSKPADRLFNPLFFPEWKFGDFGFEKLQAPREMIRDKIEKKIKTIKKMRAARELRTAFRPLSCGVGGWSSMRGRCIGLRSFASSKGK